MSFMRSDLENMSPISITAVIFETIMIQLNPKAGKCLLHRSEIRLFEEKTLLHLCYMEMYKSRKKKPNKTASGLFFLPKLH
jgi:hypothetical protein